jgi:FkbM family methyltransferase
MIHSPKFLRHLPFFHRLFASLVRIYAAAFHERYLVQRRMGVLLLLDQRNAVDKRLLCRGEWEPEQLDFLSSALRVNCRVGEKAVFLDIGSHGGLYALVLQSRFSFDEVVAFEPMASNLLQLRANLLMNGASSKVVVVEAAVSDQEGFTEFVVGADRNRGMSRIADGKLRQGEAVTEVNTITIDYFKDYTNYLIAVKIDVEGGEIRVLHGMKRTLLNNRCILQVERHGDTTELIEFLEGAGYRLLQSIGPDYFFSNFEER